MIKSTRCNPGDSKFRKTVPKHCIDLVFQSTPSSIKKQAETPLNIKNSLRSKRGHLFLFDKPLFKGRSISLTKLPDSEALKNTKNSHKPGGSSFVYNLISSTSRNFLIETSAQSNTVESLLNEKVQAGSHIQKIQKNSFNEKYKQKLGLIKRNLRMQKGLLKK